jgi:two-component system, cell cycle sensor histidine kinase and response regulator CckA
MVGVMPPPGRENPPGRETTPLPTAILERIGWGRHGAGVIPIVLALIAAFGVLVLDGRVDGLTAVAVRLAIAATIVLVVVRQTLHLHDRRVAVGWMDVATAQANAADVEARRTSGLLSEAEERFRRLVEQIPAAVYVDRLQPDRTDVSGSVYISPRVTALTGFTPEEMAADRNLWESRIHADDLDAVRMSWGRHSVDGVPFTATYRFHARDGRIVWLAENAEILVGNDGQAFTQGLVVDVTERRETDDRLRQAQKMEAVGQLAGGVAHDFNNFLTVITGHAGLLLETTDDPSSRVDIEAIAAAAASSADLVGQLLAFGRRTMMRPEVTDLSGVVTDVLPMLRRLLPENIEIVTTIRSELPAVRVDPGQIQQVVLNLAINGRDAMPTGGRLRIETAVRDIGPLEAARMLGCKPGSYVELSIADEGVGMDAATRDRIFEPFFTTKSAGHGTGLGLATVYGIVKQSEGYIALDSAVSRGSTFRVLIPASTSAAANQPDSEPPRPTRGHERIILCKDEAAVRDLVATVLTRAGYSVVAAATPAQALLLVADEAAPPDLLLTDVVMPDISGPDLARRARSLRPGLRVLLMSGYSRESLDRDTTGLDAGFLAKPFTPAGLAGAVRDVLDGAAPDEVAPVGTDDTDASVDTQEPAIA